MASTEIKTLLGMLPHMKQTAPSVDETQIERGEGKEEDLLLNWKQYIERKLPVSKGTNLYVMIFDPATREFRFQVTSDMYLTQEARELVMRRLRSDEGTDAVWHRIKAKLMSDCMAGHVTYGTKSHRLKHVALTICDGRNDYAFHYDVTPGGKLVDAKENDRRLWGQGTARWTRCAASDGVEVNVESWGPSNSAIAKCMDAASINIKELNGYLLEKLDPNGSDAAETGFRKRLLAAFHVYRANRSRIEARKRACRKKFESEGRYHPQRIVHEVVRALYGLGVDYSMADLLSQTTVPRATLEEREADFRVIERRLQRALKCVPIRIASGRSMAREVFTSWQPKSTPDFSTYKARDPMGDWEYRLMTLLEEYFGMGPAPQKKKRGTKQTPVVLLPLIARSKFLGVIGLFGPESEMKTTARMGQIPGRRRPLDKLKLMLKEHTSVMGDYLQDVNRISFSNRILEEIGTPLPFEQCFVKHLHKLTNCVLAVLCERKQDGRTDGGFVGYKPIFCNCPARREDVPLPEVKGDLPDDIPPGLRADTILKNLVEVRSSTRENLAFWGTDGAKNTIHVANVTAVLPCDKCIRVPGSAPTAKQVEKCSVIAIPLTADTGSDAETTAVKYLLYLFYEEPYHAGTPDENYERHIDTHHIAGVFETIGSVNNAWRKSGELLKALDRLALGAFNLFELSHFFGGKAVLHIAQKEKLEQDKLREFLSYVNNRVQAPRGALYPKAMRRPCFGEVTHEIRYFLSVDYLVESLCFEAMVPKEVVMVDFKGQGIAVVACNGPGFVAGERVSIPHIERNDFRASDPSLGIKPTLGRYFLWDVLENTIRNRVFHDRERPRDDGGPRAPLTITMTVERTGDLADLRIWSDRTAKLETDWMEIQEVIKQYRPEYVNEPGSDERKISSDAIGLHVMNRIRSTIPGAKILMKAVCEKDALGEIDRLTIGECRFQIPVCDER